MYIRWGDEWCVIRKAGTTICYMFTPYFRLYLKLLFLKSQCSFPSCFLCWQFFKIFWKRIATYRLEDCWFHRWWLACTQYRSTWRMDGWMVTMTTTLMMTVEYFEFRFKDSMFQWKSIAQKRFSLPRCCLAPWFFICIQSSCLLQNTHPHRHSHVTAQRTGKRFQRNILKLLPFVAKFWPYF